MSTQLFAPLEQSPAFRADMLYFLRLAGNYIANMLIMAREGAPSKHRKTYALWLDTTPPPISDPQLMRALKHKEPWFDAFKSEFSIMLETMPIPMQNRLATSIKNDHCLPLSLHELTRILDALRDYRHWLEHYDERVEKRQKRPADDRDLLHYLGLLLLPHLLNHLHGRIRYHQRKQGVKATLAANVKIRAIFDQATQQRRATTMAVMGARSKGVVVRKERQEVQQAKERWRAYHAQMFSAETWPRYNLHNFKIRYFFIGTGRLDALETLLQIPDRPDSQSDFIQALEPLFNLSLDINLAIHLYLNEAENHGVKIRDRKKVDPIICDLRNEIAHGGFFWNVRPKGGTTSISVEQIFFALQRLAAQFPVEQKQIRNRYVDAIRLLCQRSRISLAYPQMESDDVNQHPPPLRIRRWTTANRTKFTSPAYRIEKRPALRRAVSQWVRNLDAAIEKIDKLGEL